MKRVTISLSDGLYEKGRKYALAHHMTFRELLRQLLIVAILKDKTAWTKEWFKIIDKLHYRSGGRRDWKREDLYRV